MTDTEKIKELYKEYWKHMISKDAYALEVLMLMIIN